MSSICFGLCAESSWERLARADKPIVVYGTGNGADAVLDELIRLGVEVSGFAASDGFARGQSFRGHKVQKISEVGSNCIVAVAFASSLPQVTDLVYSLAERVETVVPCVPVAGKEIFNRAFAEQHAEEINKAYQLMADDESRKVFCGYVNFELSGELNYLRATQSHKDEAFNSVLRLSAAENYLDIGAYRGDTVEEFLHYCGGSYSSVTALEPDIKSYKKLSDYLQTVRNSAAINAAASDFCGEGLFESKAGRQSSFGESGKPVAVTSVDALAQGKPFTYIKIDAEGAEEQVLRGAEKTLGRLKPKLNVAAYHRAGDIFRLPIMINELNPGYKIYLRRHPYIPAFDTNLYCI